MQYLRLFAHARRLTASGTYTCFRQRAVGESVFFPGESPMILNVAEMLLSCSNSTSRSLLQRTLVVLLLTASECPSCVYDSGAVHSSIRGCVILLHKKNHMQLG